MTRNFVDVKEIAREITLSLLQKSETKSENVVSVTPQQVQSVFKCIGNFLNFMFRKTHYEWVVAEVFSFGTFLRNSSTKQSEFIPSHHM